MVKNFTLNVGLRWEEQNVRNRFGQTAFSINDNWARLLRPGPHRALTQGGAQGAGLRARRPQALQQQLAVLASYVWERL
ncbi:MAG TPA: hypothetical protein VEQ10_19350 [Vicinamibacteria bacterium]|nr:hypothetical protein [Vicinamibacteria bacterium]